MPNRPASEASRESFESNLVFTSGLTKNFPKAPNYRDAIRRKCLDCCVGDRAEVASCQITTCALWPFRFGSNPLQ